MFCALQLIIFASYLKIDVCMYKSSETVNMKQSVNYHPLSHSFQTLLPVTLLTEVVVNRVGLLGEEE